MFKNVVPLDFKNHRQLSYDPSQPYYFASKLMTIPLTAAELCKAAREFVIVFPLNGGVPQALVGTARDKNVHVDESGHWIGRYIPAHIRRYPFILHELEIDEDQRIDSGRRFGIQVDISAPHFTSSGGFRLFDDTGVATDFFKKIQTLLLQIQADFEKTVKMVRTLESLNLLVAREIEIKGGEQSSSRVGGFRVVDIKALTELSEQQLSLLHPAGALAMIYAHIVSLTNLEDGYLAKKISTDCTTVTQSHSNIAENDLFQFNL